MILLKEVKDEHYNKVKAWAYGDSKGWYEPLNEDEQGLVVFVTPRPWRFIIGFCDCSKIDNENKLTPLLMLKNVYPLYYSNYLFDLGQISVETWNKIKEETLFHNPGIMGALSFMEETYLKI